MRDSEKKYTHAHANIRKPKRIAAKKKRYSQGGQKKTKTTAEQKIQHPKAGHPVPPPAG